MSSCSPYFGLRTSERFSGRISCPVSRSARSPQEHKQKTGGPPIGDLPDEHKYLCQRGGLHAVAFTLGNRVGPAVLARAALF